MIGEWIRFNTIHSSYYNIDLTGIRVAGKDLLLDSRVFDGEHGVVLDSGTTYAYLPDAAFSAFEEAVRTLKSLFFFLTRLGLFILLLLFNCVVNERSFPVKAD